MDLQETEKLHPLLVPSVMVVLLENLYSSDIHKCIQVCKKWKKVFRNQSSPFYNPRIFAHLINFISEQDVFSCRLVCKLWNQMITESKQWTITSTDYNIFPWGRPNNAFFKTCIEIGNDNIRRFQTKFGNPAELPLPLAFTYFYAHNNFDLNNPVAEEFLQIYGTSIKFLILYRCKWNLQILRRILFQYLPNLEHLEIVCGIIPGTQAGVGKKITIPELKMLLHEDPTTVPPILPCLKFIGLDMNILDKNDKPRPYAEQFLLELFSSSPNAEILNVHMSSWYARTWLTEFVAANGIVLNKIKVLMHIIDPDLRQIVKLQCKQFPLSTLNIRIRYKNVTVESLHEFLISLKHTLSDLQIYFLENKCAHEFPSSQELYKLKVLKLWKFKGQLAFLKHFTALKELLIGEMQLRGQELFNQQNIFKLLLPQVEKVTFKDHWETYLFS